MVVVIDDACDIHILQICIFGCLPACILKQIVNVAQLVSAADTIAGRDAETASK